MLAPCKGALHGERRAGHDLAANLPAFLHPSVWRNAPKSALRLCGSLATFTPLLSCFFRC